uniref:DZF domain-containing protein n=1 Tax=Mesocestoides corti TaxID=53468 RepID=A0A5K3FJ03_MESCO
MQFNSPDNQRTESQVYTPPVYMRQQGPVRYGVDSHILSSQQSSPQQSHQVYTPSYPQLHYPVANAYGHGGARQSYGGGGFFAFGGPGPDYRPSMRSPRGFGGRGRFTRPASQNKGSHSDSVDAIHHYCDVCKVSCIGKQSYDAHLAGQKHKKKALQQSAQGESGENALSSVKTNELSCPLCNIKCTGVDTYKTHLTGRQHQRAVKLQTELGKAIPDCDAVAINAEKAAAAAASSQSAHAKKKRSSNSARIDSTDVDASISDDCIEEVKNGKSSVFCCRVCDCNFSDVNAKSLHLKGKKHQSALRKLRGAGDSVATTSTSGRPQVRQLSPAAAVARAAMPPPLPQQSFFGNPRIPGQTSSRFFRPLAVFVPPGQQAQQIGLPSHMLADERYMQTKLREILPSEQENSIMKLAVASVESALGRILRAQASDDERNQPRRGTRLPKGAEGFEAVIGQRDVDGVKVQAPTHDSVRPLSGVFRVGALASGLLLRGQHTAEMVLVLEKLPPAHYLTEVAEELEELLKESCKDHVVIVATIDGALVVHVTPSTLKESASASTAGAAPIAVSVRVRLTSTQILGNKAKAELKRADGGDADSDHADAHLDDLDDDDGGDDDDRVRKALLCSGLSKELCIDALTDVRRALWLQDALAQHPAVGNVVNVARVFSSLIRESQPCQWGKIPDYVLLVLLERLSFMDLPPVFQGGPPKLRAGLLLRRFLESLSAGILMSPGGELHTLRDPSTITHTLPFPEARLLPVTPLLADMSPEDREKATFAAQTCLRLVSFRQIFKVLNVPKFIPTPQRSSSSDVPKNGVAAKRKSTVENASLDDDDDDEDGVVGVCPSSDGQPIPMAGSSLAS